MSCDNVTLQPATPADAEKILWLEEVCMKDLATALWGNWRASDTVATLDISHHEMVAVDGKSVGCIATRRETDGWRLLKLYLAPEARNQGIGAIVLGQVIVRAAKLPLRLRVLVNNPAVRFYNRHGFRMELKTDEHVYMIRDADHSVRGAQT